MRNLIPKILIFSPFPPTMSGASWASYNFFKRLKKEMKITGINYNGFLREKNIIIFPVFPGKENSAIRGPLFILIGFLLGFFAVKILKIDLIYAKNLSTPAITGYIVSKVTRKPLVIHTSGPDIQNLEGSSPTNWQDPLDAFYRKILSFFLLKELHWAHAIIANCEADLKVLKKIGYGFKTKLIYNGVDFKTFRRDQRKRDSIRKSLKISSQERLIVFTGQFTWQKNLVQFNKIANSFPEIHFLIVGLNKSYRKQNLIGRKRVLPNKLAGYLSASDIFLITSHGEGLSNSLLEAIAAENFPISSSVGDHNLLFTNAGEGEIFNSFKESLLILSKLEVMPIEEIHNKALKIRDYIVNKFSWKNSSQKMENIFLYTIKMNIISHNKR